MTVASSGNHRIHGLDKQTTRSPWPTLRNDDIVRLLAHYPGHELTRICWHSPRPFSSALRADTSLGPVFIKRHHPTLRSLNDLRWEHALITHLQQHGIPIAKLLRTADGDTAVAVEGWHYEVHHLAQGDDLYADTPSWVPLTNTTRAFSAGAMLAQLHHAAAGYQPTPRATKLLVATTDLLCAADPLNELATQLSQRPGLAHYLNQQPAWQQQLAPLLARQRVIRSALTALPPLCTHNDWHVSNLCWQHDQVSTVFDFGLSAITFALYDLAIAIERNCISWLELETQQCKGYIATAHQLLAGYQSILPLSAHERSLLTQLLPIVHLDFAISEIDYFMAIEHDRHKADIAWHQFLLGHAAWFDSTAGAAFIECINADNNH